MGKPKDIRHRRQLQRRTDERCCSGNLSATAAGDILNTEQRIAEPSDAIRRSRRPNEIWACDITQARDRNGKTLYWFAIVDEFTLECLCLDVKRNWDGADITTSFDGIAQERGLPQTIRTDNEKLWCSRSLKSWLRNREIGHRLIRNGSPWQNGVVESFFSQLHRELLNLATFSDLADAEAQAKQFQEVYNEIRPHGSLGFRPPSKYARSLQRPQ